MTLLRWLPAHPLVQFGSSFDAFGSRLVERSCPCRYPSDRPRLNPWARRLEFFVPPPGLRAAESMSVSLFLLHPLRLGLPIAPSQTGDDQCRHSAQELAEGLASQSSGFVLQQ